MRQAVDARERDDRSEVVLLCEDGGVGEVDVEREVLQLLQRLQRVQVRSLWGLGLGVGFGNGVK